MRVVFICDDGYAMPTTVTIASLVRATSSATNLEIAVVTCGMGEQGLRSMEALGRPNAKIAFIDGTELLSHCDLRLSDSPYRTATKTALLKFFLPDLLPTWDKVLYLDGDLLIRRDIADLYATELGSHYAAVVPDLPQTFYEQPLIGDNRDYFNSGVMLLNLALLRNQSTSKLLVSTKKGLVGDNLADQNTFNKVFAGNVVHLSPEYNLCCMNLQRRWRREHMLDKINDAYQADYRSYRDLTNRSAIIHFSSSEKPWKYHDVLFAREWDRHYHATSYGSIPLKRKSIWLQRRLQFIRHLFL